MTRWLWSVVVLFGLPLSVSATEPLTQDPVIRDLLEPVRKKFDLPGLVGGVVEGGHVVACAAVGVRKDGSTVKMTVNDALHMGSCTKSMTATMLATLVDSGTLSWDTTLSEAFPDQRTLLHPDLRSVTLAQLLTHRSGLRLNAPWETFSTSGSTGMQQRRALFRKVLREPPEVKPGSKHLYSNLGYVVAAMMAEAKTKKSWEDLMRERLFRPLKMTSSGFGPPGAKGRIDQPWGHRLDGLHREALQADNPIVLGPAGMVHCSLADWAAFIALHLDENRTNGLLKADTLRHLHTPPEGQSYAYGWAVVAQPWAKGQALNHAGNNTMWVSNVWAAPRRNLAFLVATNQGGAEDSGKDTFKATDAAIAALAEHWLAK